MNTVHIFCLKGNKLRQVYTTDINNTCLHTVDRKSKAKGTSNCTITSLGHLA